MKSNQPINPLAAYLSGEANEEQIRQVEEWLQANAENQELYQKLSEAWNEQQTGGDAHFRMISPDRNQEGVLEED
ncbi:MAG: hypothetical protein SF052_04400 [Bacteroidia bacterium]|nr:hypothetical protein [Bacteroidia bacterium]